MGARLSPGIEEDQTQHNGFGHGTGDEANLKALLAASKGTGSGPATGTCLHGNAQAGESELTKGLS